MSTPVGIRSLHRNSNVRIGTQQIRTNVTAVIDLDDPVSRRDLARHYSIGNVIATPLLDDFQGTTATLTNAGTANALKINQNGNASASTSAGGALNVTNTNSTGAGIVVYSNRGADAAGRLVVIRSDNVLNPQQALYVENSGSGHTMLINHKSTGSNANALVLTSTNENDTTLGITGVELGKGTIKASHNKPPSGGNDANASALSLRCNGSGTAAQGIFFDSEQAGGTTGKLQNFRQNGIEFWVVTAAGLALAKGGFGCGNSLAATTLGAVVKKMEVFDMAGASLGFVPIYNTIT
jgi:hypothetical protein